MKRIGPIIGLAILAGACAPDNPSPAVGGADVVEVIATGLTFEAPEEIPSGWTTLRFRNESGLIHFALVERLPAGVGIEGHQKEVAPLFQEGVDLLKAGATDAALQKFGELPEWFGQLVFVGGPGLTSGGETSQATLYLEPGTYLIECYVKTNGIFHSYNPDPDSYGMVHEFTVTEEPSGATEPSATLRITLSAAGGIEVEGDPVPGEHTVAVHFEDQTVHENFVGHDVHLVRLSDDVELDTLARWMDWRLPEGLETPAPARFLGGINEMPAGKTAYFTVTLEPGEYAWIAEVPNPGEKNMLKTFSVTPGR